MRTTHHLTRRSILQLGAVAGAAAVVGAPLRGHAAPWAGPSSRALIRPGAGWRDIGGHLITARSGGMCVRDGVFYWIGATAEPASRFEGFSVYASRDLARWKRVSQIFEEVPSQLHRWMEIARPKMLWNEKNRQWVVWFKQKSYGAEVNDVHHAVAVSPSLEGPWTYHADYYPGGYNTADSFVWREEDGTAYLVASSPGRRYGSYARRIIIFRLSEDYLEVEPDPVWVGPEDGREAPVIFMKDGWYYQLTSYSSGWRPNRAKFRAARSLEGPWSDLRAFTSSRTTFNSQPDFVFPVTGSETTTWIYAGTRHNRDVKRGARSVWLPIEFTDRRPSISWYSAWSIDVTTGRWSG